MYCTLYFLQVWSEPCHNFKTFTKIYMYFRKYVSFLCFVFEIEQKQTK